MGSVGGVPVPPNTANRLRAAAAKIDQWTTERDLLIAEAVEAGGSLREVAAEAGVSHQTVKNITARSAP